MATVNFIPESNQSISAMKAVIDYCLQQKKVADEESGRRLVGGVNCNGENPFDCLKKSYDYLVSLGLK